MRICNIENQRQNKKSEIYVNFDPSNSVDFYRSYVHILHHGTIRNVDWVDDEFIDGLTTVTSITADGSPQQFNPSQLSLCK